MRLDIPLFLYSFVVSLRTRRLLLCAGIARKRKQYDFPFEILSTRGVDPMIYESGT